jgi:hypothetical protein
MNHFYLLLLAPFESALIVLLITFLGNLFTKRLNDNHKAKILWEKYWMTPLTKQ